MSTPTTGSIEVELYFGPLDGTRTMLGLLEDGKPPELHAFPCPGGRGDMLYRRAPGRATANGRLAYEWTGERAPG